MRTACPLLLALVVVVDLEQHAAAFRLERPVVRPRWTAGIGVGREWLSALAVLVVADDEVTGHQVDLLPMVVHERSGGKDTRFKAQQPGSAAHLFRLVEVTGEDLLLDA